MRAAIPAPGSTVTTVRDALRAAVTEIPHHAGPPVQAPVWVAALAAGGLWLATYQRTLPLADAERDALVDALSDHAGVPRPESVRWRCAATDARRAFRDQHPVADAVVRLACEQGVEAVTLEAVGERAGCGVDHLEARFGTAQRLLDDVADWLLAGEPAGALSLRLRPTRDAVHAHLAALYVPEAEAAVLLAHALAGVGRSVPPEQRERHARLARLCRRDAGHAPVVVAALALDAWRTARREPALRYPAALPTAVVGELARLADGGHGAGRGRRAAVH